MNGFIVGLTSGEREYNINGVKYTVSAKFQPRNHENDESNITIKKRFKRVIKSDFTDLTICEKDNKITDNQVNTVAGKED